MLRNGASKAGPNLRLLVALSGANPQEWGYTWKIDSSTRTSRTGRPPKRGGGVKNVPEALFTVGKPFSNTEDSIVTQYYSVFRITN